MSDTCPTCQHERSRHDGNTPGCIECGCNDLWGDGEYFVYSDLSLLAELADEVERLRALTTVDEALFLRCLAAAQTTVDPAGVALSLTDLAKLTHAVLEAALGVES